MLNFLTIFIYFLSNALKIFTILFYSIFISLGISLDPWETFLSFSQCWFSLVICRFPFHFCKGLFFFYFSSEFCPLIFFSSFALDFYLIYLWLCHAAWGILVPWPGIKLTPLAVKARSPNNLPANSHYNLQFFSCYSPKVLEFLLCSLSS